MLESKYQKKIIDKYKKDGWYVINLIKTSVNGIPDILCLKEGEKPLFIEVKGKNGVLSKLQEFRIRELKNLGFDAFVSRNNEN